MVLAITLIAMLPLYQLVGKRILYNITIDPDVLELIDESVKYPPIGRGLDRDGEDGSVGSNVGPDFHLSLPTPRFLLPLHAPCLQVPQPLVEMTGDENRSLCLGPGHRAGLLASCSSPEKYGDGNLLCPDD